jgi:hypothetical protein
MMLDVSANLYSALPQAFGVARLPASRSLVKPDENLSGGNSLQTIASQLRPETAVADFTPKPANEQGFLSLSPVLASLRLSPEQLVPASENQIPVWEQLLNQQQEIADARRAAAKEQEELEQQRRQAAAERIASEERIRELRDEVVFSNTPAQKPGETEDSSPEPVPLPGQGGADEPVVALGTESDRLFPPDTEFPALNKPDLPAGENRPKIDLQLQAEQQRVKALFNDTASQDTAGSRINLFA